MNSYQIIFSLNETQKIIVDLQDQLSLIGWNDADPIIFQNNNKIITLADDPIYFNIRDMRDFLKKALNNDLLLHKSITTDIGYLANIYSKKNNFSNNSFVIEPFENGFEEWVGYRYHLWLAYKHQCAYKTWIYNNDKNNIIFEITPFYPYQYSNKKTKHYIPFKKWILSYKPYLITTLPREIAQKWLEQAEYFVKTVDDNIVRCEEEYKKLENSSSLTKKEYKEYIVQKFIRDK